VLNSVSGESVFGIFLFSSDNAQLLQHIRARYSLRCVAVLPILSEVVVIAIEHDVADFWSNSCTWCRAIIMQILMRSPPATPMPYSCYGKGSALEASLSA
jgi:hypothetical protein